MTNLLIVIDTNVLISASFSRRSIPHEIVQEVLLRHTLLVSSDTYSELKRRLLLPKFDRYVSAEERLRFLSTLRFAARLIDVRTVIAACRDSKDNNFLELAVDGQADFIVTGDHDLLVLHPFQSIEIRTPRAFLDRIRQR